MRCISPLTLRLPREDAFGVKRTTLTTVPCGKCAACLSRRKDEWVLRLKQEFKDSGKSVFVTLTYNELSLPLSDVGLPTLRMTDVSAFMKRLRKRIGSGVRFFGCGEYGSEFNRPHYHILLFNVPDDIDRHVQESWNYGFIQCSPLNEQRIAYTCKYVLSSSNFVDEVPFTFGSRGINARNLLYDIRLDQLSGMDSLPIRP